MRPVARSEASTDRMGDPKPSVVGSNDQPDRPLDVTRRLGGVMDVDPSWSFDDYKTYERTRLNESLAEQVRAHTDGLEVDPKSEPHGGYRIACLSPDQVTSAASALSARLADLLPGTPAYPTQAIHSSIGNISAPDGKLVDPDRHRENRDLLDRLADAVETALAADLGERTNERRVAFGPALLSPRMALVFGRPQPGSAHGMIGQSTCRRSTNPCARPSPCRLRRCPCRLRRYSSRRLDPHNSSPAGNRSRTRGTCRSSACSRTRSRWCTP
jgi:hypothetical protein